ncbi:MAG: GAF domain-containing protein [Desulfosalsimonadaceae bacterium]
MAENARLEHFFKVVTSVSRALHESSDLSESLQIMVETVTEVFHAKGCTLRVLDPTGKEFELMAATGLSSAYLEKGVVIADSHLSEVFEDQLVVIDNVASDPRIQYPDAAIAEGIISIIGVPFQVTGNMRMVLRIYFDRRLSLTEEDHRLLYYMAQQSAITIKNAIQQTRYLETFRKVSTAIHEGDAVNDILESIVSTIREIMEARGCIYWIVDTDQQQVYMKVTSGFQMNSLSHISYDILKDVFRFEEEKEIFFKDVREDPRIPSSTGLGKQMVTSILGVPFHIVDQYRGILAVYFSKPRKLAQSEVNFVRDSGRQGAIALHKAFRYDERMLKAFREIIEGLVLALEAKDVCTHGHSLNVANYGKMAAEQMGLSAREAEEIYRGGLLHDIGKIAMQDNILGNLGHLSPGDFETVKKHPVIGAKIIGRLSLLNEVAPIILYHHERYDGSGYPEGLTGEAIPMGARIIAVSDAFDAMTSDRPKKENMSISKALNHLQLEAGTKFDPQVVKAFVQAIEANIDSVSPYTMPENYVCTDYGQNSGEKRKAPVFEWIRRYIPGF